MRNTRRIQLTTNTPDHVVKLAQSFLDIVACHSFHEGTYVVKDGQCQTSFQNPLYSDLYTAAFTASKNLSVAVTTQLIDTLTHTEFAVNTITEQVMENIAMIYRPIVSQCFTKPISALELLTAATQAQSALNSLR